MQTFRAFLQDETGALVWAAWIEATHHTEAVQKAQALCGAAALRVEVWSSTDRRLGPAEISEPV